MVTHTPHTSQQQDRVLTMHKAGKKNKNKRKKQVLKKKQGGGDKATAGDPEEEVKQEDSDDTRDQDEEATADTTGPTSSQAVSHECTQAATELTLESVVTNGDTDSMV